MFKSLLRRRAGPSLESIRRETELFEHSQVVGSVILVACTVLALLWANSRWSALYFELQHLSIGFSLGDRQFVLPLDYWINDALMAVFFLVVGLEIKRELTVGQLASVQRAILPVMAALGGMLVPAAIYLALNPRMPASHGWAIPMATDIAFALGALALLGPRVPASLKIFLTALAIADDMGAVLVIALFYTQAIDWPALVLALALLAGLAFWTRSRFGHPGFTLLLCVGIWLAVFASGVHATLAGILIALTVPVRARINPETFLLTGYARLEMLEGSKLTSDSMLHDPDQLRAIVDLHRAARDMEPPGIRLEHAFQPLLSYLILPLFALFNAGIVIDERIGLVIRNPVALGVILGLVVGKPLGITLLTWLAVRSGRAALPHHVRWGHIVGVGCLAGIGFTMSLLIAGLAFTDPEQIEVAKLGILIGSAISAVLGLGLLALQPRPARA